MKQFNVLLLSALFCTAAVAQSVTETVSTTAGYANQVWYNLENGTQTPSPKANWDLAFDAAPFGFSVLINSAIGTEIWSYPNGDTSAWATLDTTGMSGWTPLYNPDTSWAYGALNMNANFSDPFDLGWGQYNQITHNITGKRIYVIKLGSGQYMKLWIVNHMNNAYTIRYATLNNTSDLTYVLTKGPFAGKRLAYFAFATGNALNREPLSADWDVVFSQYTTVINAPAPTPYLVTGVLTNTGVQATKAYPIANPATYTNYAAHTFVDKINTIGYDWKSFNNTTFQWTIGDSIVYFVKRANGDIWKMVFTGFGGSANGNYIFDKEKLFSTSVSEPQRKDKFFHVFPNPISAGSSTTIVFDAPTAAGQFHIVVTDATGRMCLRNSITANGLTSVLLNTEKLMSGIYQLTISDEMGSATRKLVIR